MIFIDFLSSGREAFKQASRDTIKSYFVALSAHERKSKWLRKNNPYRLNCVNRYTKELKDVPPSVNHEKLIEYIAGSGPAHSIDGWSFIGRAIQALLHNDHYSAIHFGYYAELRAAMSLLGSEGLGIFNDKHSIVAGPNLTKPLPKFRYKYSDGKTMDKYARTHDVIVPSLKYWSSLKRASDLLDEIVKPGGVKLSDWLAEAGGYARTRAIAKSWLNEWGLDLSQIQTDHDARNLVSYRPSEFRKPDATNIDQLAAFTRDLWSLFEPTSNYNFPNLEKYLLRLAILGFGLNPPSQSKISALGFSDSESETWNRFLTATDLPVPLIEARKNSKIESHQCPIQVISRATLLLYVATRANSLHLFGAGYTRSDLDFWWKDFGAERGLWDPKMIPDDPKDAWADINESLLDIDASLVEGPLNSLYDWRNRLNKMNRPIDDFSNWELVAIWGLVS